MWRGPHVHQPRGLGVMIGVSFWGVLWTPQRSPHTARSSAFLPRAVPLQQTFVFVSGCPRNPPAEPRTQPRSWGSSRYVQTLSAGRWQSERHRLWPAALVAFVLSSLAGSSRGTGGGRKSRAAAVGARLPLVSSPLLCSPLLLASRAAEASRASPACVCMRGRGGCRMDLAKAGREHMGWVFFFLACGGCPSCRPRLWIRSLSRSG